MRYEDGVQDFENVLDWLDYIKAGDPAERGHSDQPRENGFNMTRSLDEAIALAEQGWESGLQHIEELRVQLSEELITTLHIPEVTYDVTGDVLDIGRFVRGEPEDFMSLTPAEVERHPKVLHIVASIGASWNVSPASMIERGAAVVALADALEQHGKRVVIDCISPITRLGEFRDTRIRIKDADAPLQLANLVFLLAHPDSLRRLVFACREQAVGATRCIDNGYGLSTDPPFEERGDIYIKSLRDNTAILPFVLAQLGEQGIYAQREVEA